METLTQAVRDFLDKPHFAVVATIAPDGLPHQTVMWYALDGDELLLNTPQDSMKHKHLKRDTRISVCVEEGFSYVTLVGTVTFNNDPVTARADYEALGAKYRGKMAFTQPATPPDPKTIALLSRPRVGMRMKIEKIISSGV